MFLGLKKLFKAQSGRSMVEMLGVLAIIGVLSVGAIAGYNKAIFKYKLNKQAESFNQLITSAIRLQSDLDYAFKEGENYQAPFFAKLNLIPDGMKLEGYKIKDVFDTEIQIFYGRISSPSLMHYYMDIYFPRTNDKINQEASQICHNILNVTKENSESIERVETRAGREVSYDINKALEGDKRCTTGRACLRSMTLEDIKNTCYSCTSEKYCNMIIYFRMS